MADAEDLIKKAGEMFGKLGATLTRTTKQVTCLGRGTVRLELERTRLAPGDTLRGKVTLELSEPVDAQALVVSLRAHQRTIELERRGGGRTPVSTRSEIFRFDRELGGAQRYDSRTVAFELVVPPDALDRQAPAGSHPIADAVRSVAAVLSPQTGPVEWSVSARLAIAWGRDLAHEVDVTIAR